MVIKSEKSAVNLLQRIVEDVPSFRDVVQFNGQSGRLQVFLYFFQPLPVWICILPVGTVYQFTGICNNIQTLAVMHLSHNFYWNSKQLSHCDGNIVNMTWRWFIALPGHGNYSQYCYKNVSLHNPRGWAKLICNSSVGARDYRWPWVSAYCCIPLGIDFPQT